MTTKKPITDDVIQQIHRNLVDTYGPAVTLEYVKAQVAKLQAGEKPTNIMGMLAESMLKKGGYA